MPPAANAPGWEECDECDGEGTVEDDRGREVDCPTCDGEGEVLRVAAGELHPFIVRAGERRIETTSRAAV
jgi:DnaJ-class molecular chaperone